MVGDAQAGARIDGGCGADDDNTAALAHERQRALNGEGHALYVSAEYSLFDTQDATSIAYTVGYESASQFSREYARLFGLPPARDAARFKLPPAAQAEPVS